jgi:hypothetical protein
MIASAAPTHSVWFQFFMNGFWARVGERRRQDAAISIQVMLKIQDALEAKLATVQGPGRELERLGIIEHGASFFFSTVPVCVVLKAPKCSLPVCRTNWWHREHFAPELILRPWC